MTLSKFLNNAKDYDGNSITVICGEKKIHGLFSFPMSGKISNCFELKYVTVYNGFYSDDYDQLTVFCSDIDSIIIE